MAQMRPLLDPPLLIGVGAAFDFHAGLVPQAPNWLQEAGLEWAYRLAHEPRRLWRRYLRYNPRFMTAFARQLAADRRPGAEPWSAGAPAPGESAVSGEGEDFLSGTSGQVAGIRRTAAAILADGLVEAVAHARLERPRLRRGARRLPRRRVLALAIERTDAPNLLAAARTELLRSRHDVDFLSTDVGRRGKFENLNGMLAQRGGHDYDWLLALDDDVMLPAGFLDGFLFLAERFGLQLAQPAHRHRSHAAWQVTRRRRGSVVRESAFVEIGPVFAFHHTTFSTLLPFPPLRAGWGLDLHWSAVARARGWRLGIVDATPIGHDLRPVAGSYDRGAAIAEARTFLADRPYVRAVEAQRTLRTHRRWRGRRV